MNDALRVLIVEDNRDLGDMLAEYLQEVGHEATAVASAEDAIALLEQRSVDVVMTDVRLPGASGIELAQKTVARWPRTGIVISSGYGDALELAFFPPELIPVVVLTPKPCDLPRLPQILTEAAAKARAQ